MTPASHQIRQQLAQHRSQIQAIATAYGATNLRLFGSVALGQATETSDIDLLADIEPRRSLLDRIALKQDLEDLLGRPVDIARPEQLHPAIRVAVLAQAIAIDTLEIPLTPAP